MVFFCKLSKPYGFKFRVILAGKGYETLRFSTSYTTIMYKNTNTVITKKTQARSLNSSSVEIQSYFEIS